MIWFKRVNSACRKDTGTFFAFDVDHGDGLVRGNTKHQQRVDPLSIASFENAWGTLTELTSYEHLIEINLTTCPGESNITR